MRNRYIVSYDIRDPKRLRKVFVCMRGFGESLQYSVFRCDLTAREKALMITKLTDIIHHRDDRVMIVDLGPSEGRGAECFEFLGQSRALTADHVVIV
ncbi:MAG: CRISPR-associated endonuclease Cas2 [Planctomycetes bacterium]|nr:CRISPR-associated endonuclease Cas2 [Planctomycetota bacterium]